MSTVRAGRSYSTEHEWVLADSDSDPAVVRVGISAIAADALGDIVFVDLPLVGASLTAGAVCGEVESTKSVAELFAPVSGTVIEANSAVANDPALLNTDPYGVGWLFTVRVSQNGPLMTAIEYAAEQGVEVE